MTAGRFREEHERAAAGRDSTDREEDAGTAGRSVASNRPLDVSAISDEPAHVFEFVPGRAVPEDDSGQVSLARQGADIAGSCAE